MLLLKRIGTAVLGTLAMLAVAAGGCVEASAAPGDLDPTFGGGDRIVTPDANNPPGSGVEVVLQPDVAGWIG